MLLVPLIVIGSAFIAKRYFSNEGQGRGQPPPEVRRNDTVEEEEAEDAGRGIGYYLGYCAGVVKRWLWRIPQLIVRGYTDGSRTAVHNAGPHRALQVQNEIRRARTRDAVQYEGPHIAHRRLVEVNNGLDASEMARRVAMQCAGAAKEWLQHYVPLGINVGRELLQGGQGGRQNEPDEARGEVVYYTNVLKELPRAIPQYLRGEEPAWSADGQIVGWRGHHSASLAKEFGSHLADGVEWVRDSLFPRANLNARRFTHSSINRVEEQSIRPGSRRPVLQQWRRSYPSGGAAAPQAPRAQHQMNDEDDTIFTSGNNTDTILNRRPVFEHEGGDDDYEMGRGIRPEMSITAEEHEEELNVYGARRLQGRHQLRQDDRDPDRHAESYVTDSADFQGPALTAHSEREVGRAKRSRSPSGAIRRGKKHRNKQHVTVTSQSVGGEAFSSSSPRNEEESLSAIGLGRNSVYELGENFGAIGGLDFPSVMDSPPRELHNDHYGILSPADSMVKSPQKSFPTTAAVLPPNIATDFSDAHWNDYNLNLLSPDISIPNTPSPDFFNAIADSSNEGVISQRAITTSTVQPLQQAMRSTVTTGVPKANHSQQVRRQRPLLPKPKPTESNPPVPRKTAEEHVKAQLNQEQKHIHIREIGQIPDCELISQDSNGDTILHHAIDDSNLEYLAALVVRLAKFRGMLKRKNYSGQSALDFAIYENKACAVLCLAEAMVNVGEKKLVTQVDSDGNTYIHKLCELDDEYAVVLKRLLEIVNPNGKPVFDINKRNQYGCTPLHVLARASKTEDENLKLLEVLMNHGCDPLSKDGSGGRIPLFFATEADAQNVAFIRKMVELLPEEQRKALLSWKDSNKRTVLHFMAQMDKLDHQEYKDLLKFLINHGADPIATDSQGKTPKFYAPEDRKKVFCKENRGRRERAKKSK